MVALGEKNILAHILCPFYLSSPFSHTGQPLQLKATKVNIIVFDGLYPTHPLWLTYLIFIIAFESMIIGIEGAILSLFWERIKNRRGLWVAIIIANIVTFLIGATLQGLIQLL